MLVQNISDNWNNLQQEIHDYSQLVGKSTPKVIAVSKTRTQEEINAAWDSGIRCFGENYSQELAEKATQLPQAEWHFIGRLQRKNAPKITPHTNFIHSLDSIKLANRLAFLKFDGTCLIQVNISKEKTKSGIAFDLVSDLLNHAISIGLNVKGFMAMGSFTWSTEEIKEGFDNFYSFTQKFNLPEISLGMSEDWKEAIKTGSTIIRIGTLIFGERIK